MFRQLVGNLLNRRMPTKTKRMAFAVSFFALLKGETSYDRETFEKLNRALSLSESGEAPLAVPAILAKVIWDGKTPMEVCQDNVLEGPITSDRLSKIVANMLGTMPKWLMYGATEDIEKDVAVIHRFALKGA